MKYTPKPLNNKESPILNLSSKKLSNCKLERGAGGCRGKLTHPFIVRLSAHDEGKAVVIIEKGKVKTDEIIKAVENAGFSASKK